MKTTVLGEVRFFAVDPDGDVFPKGVKAVTMTARLAAKKGTALAVKVDHVWHAEEETESPMGLGDLVEVLFVELSASVSKSAAATPPAGLDHASARMAGVVADLD